VRTLSSIEEDVLPVVTESLDHGRLQGTWDFFAGPREAQLIVTGDQFTIRFRNGEVYQGTFILGPTERPKTLDMVITEGPERHRGQKSLGIYAFDGDRLIWSTGKPGSTQRPRFFPAREDREPLCIVFRRQKEPRAVAAPHAMLKSR
jgi:uncharacterized protein (TIGR03067 family)